MSSSAQAWSDKGKIAFVAKDYQQALIYYTKAIALEDAEKSTQLDPSNIKGHLLTGQIIAMKCQANHDLIDELDVCIEKLTKALTLCAGQKMQKNEKYLHDNIRRVKKLKWLIQRESEKKRDSAIMKHIFNQIKSQENESEEVKNKQIQLVKDTLDQPEDFSIPSYYLCALSKTILSDPVTTKYQNTFERKYLEEYFFSAKAYRDPLSQQLLTNLALDLLPNINLKKAIEDFLDENPWAFEYKENQTLEDMKF